MDNSKAVWVRSALNSFCQTPDLGLGQGVDFTFPNNNKNKNKNKNPRLNFLKGNGTMVMKFGTET